MCGLHGIPLVSHAAVDTLTNVHVVLIQAPRQLTLLVIPSLAYILVKKLLKMFVIGCLALV